MPRKDIVMGLKEDTERGVVRVHLMTCPTLYLFFLRKDHPRFKELHEILERSMEQQTEVEVIQDMYSIEDARLTGRRWNMEPWQLIYRP
jgi:hypothetical protein